MKKSISLIFISLVFVLCSCNLNNPVPKQLLCGDENCSSIISQAYAELKYNKEDETKLSFPRGAVLNVYGKGENKSDSWLADYNGVKGFVPPGLIRETKVLIGSNKLIRANYNGVQSSETTESKEYQSKSPYEIIDGTTISYNIESTIQPSPTDDKPLKTISTDYQDEGDDEDEDDLLEDHDDDVDDNYGKDDEEEDEEEESTADPIETLKKLMESITLDIDDSLTSMPALNNPISSISSPSSIQPTESFKMPTSFETTQFYMQPTGKTPNELEPVNNEPISNEFHKESLNEPRNNVIMSQNDKEDNEFTTAEAKVGHDSISPIVQSHDIDTVTEKSVTHLDIQEEITTQKPPEQVSPLSSLPIFSAPSKSENLVLNNNVDVKETEVLVEKKLENFQSQVEEGLSAESAKKDLDVNQVLSVESPINYNDSQTEASPKNENFAKIEENVAEAQTPTERPITNVQSDLVEEVLSSNVYSQIKDDFSEKDEHNKILSNLVDTSVKSSEESSQTQPQDETVYQNLEELRENQIDSASVKEKNYLKDELSQSAHDSVKSGGFFTFSSWFGSSNIVDEEIKEAQPPQPHVLADESCKSTVDLEMNCKESDGQFMNNFEIVKESSSKLIYMLIAAVTVLVFTLGHSFIERTRKDSALIAKVNELKHELQIANNQLEQQNRNESVLQQNEIEESSNEIIIGLQEEIAELQNKNAELELQFESATEAGLELNKMLSDLLIQQKGRDTLLESVEQLQGQLNAQQLVIDTTNKTLLEKDKEIEALQFDLLQSNEKCELLEEELNDIRQNLNVHLKEREDLAMDLQSQIARLKRELQETILEKDTQVNLLNETIVHLNKELAIRVSEFSALNETIDKLKGDVDRDKLFEIVSCKAELARIHNERDNLQEKLKDEEEARRLLEEHVKSVDIQVKELQSGCEEAQKEKIEAQTRLEVLSNYFKEKETELQKQLGLQEAMWMQKQGDDTTIFERMKSLQEDVENYKSQTETLKKEIVDQERSLKSQLATLEKKAHENWVAARQAERRLDETKHEAAQLRNKLTLIEKANAADIADLNKSSHHNSSRIGSELNGEEISESATSSLLSPLLFPPPPLPLDPLSLPPGLFPPMPPPHPPIAHGAFLPPPPPHLPPPPPFPPNGDRRLPPLGRMSSPPPPLSPPPGDIDSHLYQPHHHRMSPTGARAHGSRSTGFRPVVNSSSSRQFKGFNQSSSHSSNESLDKASNRTGGKV